MSGRIATTSLPRHCDVNCNQESQFLFFLSYLLLPMYLKYTLNYLFNYFFSMIYSQDFFSCQFLSSSFAYCDNGVKRNCISVHEFNTKLTFVFFFFKHLRICLLAGNINGEIAGEFTVGWFYFTEELKRSLRLISSCAYFLWVCVDFTCSTFFFLRFHTAFSANLFEQFSIECWK